ncbi:MAG: hypothetical protein QG564_1846 [Campylobacterota bacterium]|nr:hypothetical protein [Campylobacterota bacterium]
MSFIENARFPEDLSVFARGGMEFRTNIIENDGGFEQRNRNWTQTRSIYSIDAGAVTKQPDGALSFVNLQNFFNACQGKFYGFRFKDFNDYTASTTTGRLGQGVGTGKMTYQLTKRYFVSGFNFYRDIYKPVSATLKVYKNTVLQTLTTHYTIDYTTGVVSFISTNTKNLSGITTGGSTATITTSLAHGYTNGQIIYISGVSGNTAINNKYFTVYNATEFTFDIIVSNSIASVLATISLFPQPTDVLTAEFEFDIPCRFDIDTLNAGFTTSGLIELDNITIVELRMKSYA